MKAYPYTDVPAEPAEGLPGVAMRWVISKNVDAPNFAMRIVELDKGSSTAYHAHAWEHEVYVLEGEGVVRIESGDTPIAPGTCVFVPCDETHQFCNTGDGMLKFICCIPNPED